MEYIRMEDFLKKYNFKGYENTVRELVFDRDWYNDEDNKIYFNVFLTTDNDYNETVILDDIWVAVIDFEDVKDNDDVSYFIEHLDKMYELVPSDKREKTYMYRKVKS